MSVRVNICMSKIMRTSIKVGGRTYVRDVRQLSNLAASCDMGQSIKVSISFPIFERLSSTDFTWSIFEYFVLYFLIEDISKILTD